MSGAAFSSRVSPGDSGPTLDPATDIPMSVALYIIQGGTTKAVSTLVPIMSCLISESCTCRRWAGTVSSAALTKWSSLNRKVPVMPSYADPRRLFLMAS